MNTRIYLEERKPFKTLENFCIFLSYALFLACSFTNPIFIIPLVLLDIETLFLSHSLVIKREKQ
jgi:hypothetical protein